MDTGLQCLSTMAMFHQLPVDINQLKHQFAQPNKSFETQDIIRAAKSLDLKAKSFHFKIDELTNNHLPAIIKTRSGDYIVLAKLALKDDRIDQLLVHDLRESSPQAISVEQFSNFWSGEIIVISRRSSLKQSLQQKFDISWFIPSLIKYRKLFGEVILASFFLQLFALITPLLFQVVMDKVLVHRGFSTLDVIAFGFLAIAVFEALLGGIRSYLLSHTTSRVDVELGARLFNHLIALPMSYFESRQVGQNVARVHELDTIRNFITGSS